MLVAKLIVEGLGLGLVLFVVCALGIGDGAVGMIHLYGKEVRDRVVLLGMAAEGDIRRRGALFKGLCVPAYMAYVLVCVYALNGAGRPKREDLMVRLRSAPRPRHGVSRALLR